MNHYFFESRGKEKVRDLMQEGMRSQAFSRSGGPKQNIFHKLPKLIIVILGILGVVELLIH